MSDEIQHEEEVVETAEAGSSVNWLFWGLLVLVLALLTGMLLPAFTQPRHRHGHRINCAGNLKQIGLALIIYAGDDVENGYFPSGDSFALLNERQYLVDGKVYVCGHAAHPNVLASKSNFVYLGAGLKDTNAQPTTTIIGHERIGNHENWVNCLYLDGHVKGHKTSAANWEEFRAEREADGEILGGVPADGGMALTEGEAVTELPKP